MKINIKKLSELTGFSQATVSNALNNKKGVNKETAEKIRKVARETGYLTDLRISNVKLVVYRASGAIVNDSPFFSSLISGVEADAHRLIPDGNFVSPSLWIRSSQTSNCHEMTAGWLEDTGLNTSSGITGASVGDSPKVRYADGMLTVSGQFDTLRLYDLSGRLVLTASTDETNVSQLPRGIYTVKLKNGQEETAGKIVIR